LHEVPELARTVSALVHAGGWLKYVTVPVFTAIIGLVTNWTGVWMLFHPLEFKGVHVPGLRALSSFTPRRLQEVPLGITSGRFGWQGIVPSRAGKMGSIAVDKGLSRLASQRDFYVSLEPERIAEQVLLGSQDEVHVMVEQIMNEQQPELWASLPEAVRAAVHDRVQEQLPTVAREVTDAIGDNIDQLFDVKLMVIRAMEKDPVLVNRIFQQVGDRELRMIVWFGAIFGGVLGIPLLFLTLSVPQWWIVPIAGVIIGWVTNYLAIACIFQPLEPVGMGRFRFQGLFIRRQKEVADVYAGIIADDVLTVSNIATELMHGPRGDRTRHLIAGILRSVVDRAVGMARAGLLLAVGSKEYRSLREAVAVQGSAFAMTPLHDPEFNSRQSDNIRRLMRERIVAMQPAEFSELLRSAIREDEWLLFLHGAVLGLAAGLLHALLFG
jgi:uncharacterized membrane protein YheB (UPF0754 family)